AERESGAWTFRTPEEPPPRYAFLGVRACELAAIAVQDRVFLAGPYQDPIYRARREAVFLIAVNCTQAASTCFCTSMGTGPRCDAGFDLALTELADGFVVEAGSGAGEDVLAAGSPRAAGEEESSAAEQARAAAVEQIG